VHRSFCSYVRILDATPVGEVPWADRQQRVSTAHRNVMQRRPPRILQAGARHANSFAWCIKHVNGRKVSEAKNASERSTETRGCRAEGPSYGGPPSNPARYYTQEGAREKENLAGL